MIFCCFFDRSPLTPWITAALNIYHSINEELQRYDTIRFYRPVFVRSKAGRSLQLSLSHQKPGNKKQKKQKGMKLKKQKPPRRDVTNSSGSFAPASKYTWANAARTRRRLHRTLHTGPDYCR